MNSSSTNTEKNNNINSELLSQISKSDFSIIEILNNSTDTGHLTLLGKINNINNINNSTIIKKDDKFIFKITKTQYSPTTDLTYWENTIFKMISSPNQTFKNDIYNKIEYKNIIENKDNLDLIYPASDRDIEKYRKKLNLICIETPDFYLKKIKPFIDSLDPKYTKWVTNILYENTEEILVKKENEFVISRDYKYATDKVNLYCLGIVFDAKIKSVRDLNKQHLPLLESMYEAKLKLAEIYGHNENSIQALVHYHPSFYHFHVHYISVHLDTFSAHSKRAIKLIDIINNIKIKENYYELVDLEVCLLEDSALHKIFKENK